MDETPPTETAAGAAPADPGELVILNRDLFFGVRIGNTLRALGYRVTFAPDAAAFAARLRAQPAPALGVVDITARPEWATVAALAADPALPTPILAFGPHRDVEALNAARAAGLTRVVSNGVFHRDMVGLIRRYARPPQGTAPGTVSKTDHPQGTLGEPDRKPTGRAG